MRHQICSIVFCALVASACSQAEAEGAGVEPEATAEVAEPATANDTASADAVGEASASVASATVSSSNDMRTRLVGAWVIAGGACDSGEPWIMRANGDLLSEGAEGRWSLEGDVLSWDYRVYNDYEDETKFENVSIRSRVGFLSRDRIRIDFYGPEYPEMHRCPGS